MSVWTDLGMTAEPVEFSLVGLLSLLQTVNLGVIGLVGAGVAVAWIGTFTFARIADLGGKGAPLQGKLGSVAIWLGTQTAILIGIVAMFGMLCIATGVMLRTNETGLISVAGLLAVCSTPLMVMLLEGVQVPVAQAQVLRLESVSPAPESLPARRAAA